MRILAPRWERAVLAGDLDDFDEMTEAENTVIAAIHQHGVLELHSDFWGRHDGERAVSDQKHYSSDYRPRPDPPPPSPPPRLPFELRPRRELHEQWPIYNFKNFDIDDYDVPLPTTQETMRYHIEYEQQWAGK